MTGPDEQTYDGSSKARSASHSNVRWNFSWPLQLISVGVLAFLVAACITQICPHYPRDHDEFSNLLAADTLLHGRLANPTPEVWKPLQTFHVILEPAYASKYPLGLGMMIAAGWLLFGTPIAGSWLVAGVCAASLTWMLAGGTSRRWALFGGVLFALHPAMQTTWSQSLFGGWLTAAGSALLVGGVLRLRRRPSIHVSFMLGIGVGLLALTRPFEGLICTILAAAFLWFSWQGTVRMRFRRAYQAAGYAMLPVAAVLLLIGLQNKATTGQFTTLPYQVHEAQYGVAPLFVFGEPQRMNLESSNHVPEAVKHYHEGWSLDSYKERRGITGWFYGVIQAWSVTLGYFGLSLAIAPAVTCACWLKFRTLRSASLMVAIQLLVSGAVCWIFPHYLAPIVPWLALLAVLGLRQLTAAFRRHHLLATRQFVFGAVAIQSLLLVVSVSTLYRSPNNAWAHRKANLTQQLLSFPGDHLVLVVYEPDHNVHQEWVYNGADLESQRIIWARGEREEWQEQLLEKYSAKRCVWVFNPDRHIAPQQLSSPTDQPRTILYTSVPAPRP